MPSLLGLAKSLGTTVCEVDPDPEAGLEPLFVLPPAGAAAAAASSFIGVGGVLGAAEGCGVPGGVRAAGVVSSCGSVLEPSALVAESSARTSESLACTSVCKRPSAVKAASASEPRVVLRFGLSSEALPPAALEELQPSQE